MFKILNKTTGEFVSADDAAINQRGEVIWWDDSAGWVTDVHQENFEVVFPSVEKLKKQISSYRNAIKTIHYWGQAYAPDFHRLTRIATVVRQAQAIEEEKP